MAKVNTQHGFAATRMTRRFGSRGKRLMMMMMMRRRRRTTTTTATALSYTIVATGGNCSDTVFCCMNALINLDLLSGIVPVQMASCGIVEASPISPLLPLSASSGWNLALSINSSTSEAKEGGKTHYFILFQRWNEPRQLNNISVLPLGRNCLSRPTYIYLWVPVRLCWKCTFQ